MHTFYKRQQFCRIVYASDQLTYDCCTHNRSADGDTDKNTNGHADLSSYLKSDLKSDLKSNRHTDGNTDGYTDRNTHCKSNGHTVCVTDDCGTVGSADHLPHNTNTVCFTDDCFSDNCCANKDTDVDTDRHTDGKPDIYTECHANCGTDCLADGAPIARTDDSTTDRRANNADLGADWRTEFQSDVV